MTQWSNVPRLRAIAGERVRSAVLPRLLASDTIACPRNDFQPLRLNVAAALCTLSKLAPSYAFQSLVKSFEQLTSRCGFVCHRLPFILGSGLRVSGETRSP
jgi:hypothetical protein